MIKYAFLKPCDPYLLLKFINLSLDFPLSVILFISQSTPPLVGRFVPFAAVAAANCVNIPLMRQTYVNTLAFYHLLEITNIYILLALTTDYRSVFDTSIL